MNDLTQKKPLLARVQRVDEDAHEFIVTTDEGKVYRLPQLPFQRREPAPMELPCIMDVYMSGRTHLRQDMETLIRQFYKEGDETEFTIQKAIGAHFVLQEVHGFTTKISRDLIPNPALTPKLRCRIKSIRGREIKVELVEKITATNTGFTISDDELQYYIGDTPWNTERLRQLLLDRNIGAEIFDSECHRIIADLAKGEQEDEMSNNLTDLRNHLLDALEASDMLMKCTTIERPLIENRFTTSLNRPNISVMPFI